MTKLTTWALLCAFGLVCLFSSCQSSKVAYGNSQYFKQTPRAVAQDLPPVQETEPVEQQKLYASVLEAVTNRDANMLVERAQKNLSAAVERSNNADLKEKAQRMNKLAASMKEGQLTKKEARAKRKELKKEVRSLTKEYKAMSPNATQDLDQGLKLSLILAGAGLLFLIIGGAVGGSAGGIVALLGLLALVGGIVALIIWAASS